MTAPAGGARGVVPRPLRGLSDLSRKDVRAVVLRTIDRSRADDLPGLAAGVAFKIFLALFPAMLAAGAVYGLVVPPARVERDIVALTRVLPESAAQLVATNLASLEGIGRGAAGSIAILGVLIGLFLASGAAATLVKALNRAYDIEDARPLVVQRLIGLLLNVALFATLLGVLVLVVAGEPIQEWLLPDALQVPAVELPLRAARYLLSVTLLGVLFAFTYWVGPNRPRPRWEWLSPGAVLGVVAWLAVASGFRVYTATIGGANYEQGGIYGTVGSVIVMLLWLQLSMLALLAGAELNAVLEWLRSERRSSRASIIGADALHPDEGPRRYAEPHEEAMDTEPDAHPDAVPRRPREAGPAVPSGPPEAGPAGPTHDNGRLAEDPFLRASSAPLPPPPPPPRGSTGAMAGIVASVALAALGIAGLVRRWLRSMGPEEPS